MRFKPPNPATIAWSGQRAECPLVADFVAKVVDGPEEQ
jgi:hypothetical protein